MNTILSAFRHVRHANGPSRQFVAQVLNILPAAVYVRGFHTSHPLYKRKGGSSALKAPVRGPSKAQVQRRRVKLADKEEKREDRHAAQRAIKFKAFASTQQDAIMKMEEQFSGAAAALLSPDSIINTAGYPDTSDALPGGLAEADTVLNAFKNDPQSKLTEEDCYRLSRTFALANASAQTSDLLCLMYERGVQPSSRIYAQAMLASNNSGRYRHTLDTFRVLMKEELEPTNDAWASLILAHFKLNEHNEAMKVVNGLTRAGITLTTAMYNAMIEGAYMKRDYDKAEELFIEMKNTGAEADIETYRLMMECCTRTRKAERAFFLIDEMRIMEVKPNEEVLIALLYAAATAPHHVQGFEGMIFDALDVIQSFETLPTERLYCAIITAFGRAGHSGAAQYYLEEMQQKKIEPSIASYTSVLTALAKDNMVGAKFGIKKHFVDKDESRLLTDDERLLAEAGPEEFARLASQGIETNVDGSRRIKMTKPTGNKPGARVKARIISDLPTTEEIAESIRMSRPEEVFDEDWEEFQPESKRQNLFGSRPSMKMIESSFGDEEDFGDDEEFDLDSVDDEKFVSKFMKELDLEQGKLSREEKQQLNKQLRQIEARERQDFGDDVNDDESELVARYYSAPRRTVKEEQDSLSQLAAILEEAAPAQAVLHDNRRTANEKTSSSLALHSQLSSSLRSWDPSTAVPSKPVSVTLPNEATAPIIQFANRDITQPLSMEQIDQYRELCAYGRPEPLDYSLSLLDRQQQNIATATEIFRAIAEKQMPADRYVLTAHMEVYATAFRFEEALTCFEDMKSRGIKLIPQTYRILLRMYYRTGNIPGALEFKQFMQNDGIIPDEQSYGMLVDLLARKHKIVEALQMLEEMDTHKYPLPLRYSHVLRMACHRLKMTHPLIPEDPRGFIHEGYKIRKQQRKGSSQKQIQEIRSKMFIG